MQSEEAVEVDDLPALKRNAWPHLIIGGLAMRDDDVEAIRRAALENYNQPLIACGRRNHSERRARKKAGDRGSTDHRHRSALQECSSGDAHNGPSAVETRASRAAARQQRSCCSVPDRT